VRAEKKATPVFKKKKKFGKILFWLQPCSKTPNLQTFFAQKRAIGRSYLGG
tara:strand:- start:1406 stop:1558 length:153 start_codon:yes stop_codon:yes gene_type:complete